MVTAAMAIRLKNAGLKWRPLLHDFFSIPASDLEGRIFVLSDLMAYQERFQGRQAVTFHGAVEWALDSILTSEVVWLPSETQVRELLQAQLLAEEEPTVILSSSATGFQCDIRFQGQLLAFHQATGSDAYAEALLYLLQRQIANFRPIDSA